MKKYGYIPEDIYQAVRSYGERLDINVVYEHIKDLVDMALEKVGRESHVELWREEYDEKISGKVHMYRFLFNSYIKTQMLHAKVWNKEIYPTHEVSLQRHDTDSLESSNTTLINIPGILTKSSDNNEEFLDFFESIQKRPDGSPRSKPIADSIVIPNYYYNARDLDQVEYFWEYLQSLLIDELERTEKVILVWHSFGGILATALSSQMLQRGVSASKLGVITYCTPHGECALTRKTHFQPARDLVGYTQEQPQDVPTISFVGASDEWVWDAASELYDGTGTPLKKKVLSEAWHGGNLGIPENQKRIQAAVRAIATY